MPSTASAKGTNGPTRTAVASEGQPWWRKGAREEAQGNGWSDPHSALVISNQSSPGCQTKGLPLRQQSAPQVCPTTPYPTYAPLTPAPTKPKFCQLSFHPHQSYCTDHPHCNHHDPGMRQAKGRAAWSSLEEFGFGIIWLSGDQTQPKRGQAQGQKSLNLCLKLFLCIWILLD